MEVLCFSDITRSSLNLLRNKFYYAINRPVTFYQILTSYYFPAIAQTDFENKYQFSRVNIKI